MIATSFEHGDGDFRPRIPQYPELQDLIGGAINAVLVGQVDPKSAMDDIQGKAEALFKSFRATRLTMSQMRSADAAFPREKVREKPDG